MTNYTIFMDCLINTTEDVKMLRHMGIIKNCLGNDEVIANMINNIGNHVTCSTSSYKKVYEDVNEHCSKRRNKWRAYLKNKYFSNPWLIISFLAATVLLLLTLAQTIFSILQVKETKVVCNCKI